MKQQIQIANIYMNEDSYDDLSEINFQDEFVNAGLVNEKGITEDDVDENELAMGIKTEMEHTTNVDIAKRISLDHLAEIPDYYTRLKKMEEEAFTDNSDEE